MEMFMEASRAHNKSAAIHNWVELGIKSKANDARIEPRKKKGLLLPQ